VLESGAPLLAQTLDLMKQSDASVLLGFQSLVQIVDPLKMLTVRTVRTLLHDPSSS
jgi:hypothetical protein